MSEGKSLGPWVFAAAVVLAGGVIVAATVANRTPSDDKAETSSVAPSETEDDTAPPSPSAAELGDVPQAEPGEMVTLTAGIKLPNPPLPPPHDELVKPPRPGEWLWGDVGEISNAGQMVLMDYYEQVLHPLGWELDDYVKNTSQADFTQVWRPPNLDVLVELNSFSAAGVYTFQVYVCPPAKWCGTNI